MTDPAGCGACSLCCKLMTVDDMDPVKPGDTWCTHTRPGKTEACSIYATRPDSCRKFRCMWLQSQDNPATAMPPEMRPDRSKVVFYVDDEQRIRMMMDPSRPEAHKTPLVQSFLKVCLTTERPVIATLRGRHFPLRVTRG